VIAPILAPFGFLGYFAFLSHWTGDNAAWFRAESAWGTNLDPMTPWNEVSFFFRHPFVWPGNMAQVAAIVFVVIAGVLLVRTRPPAIMLIWAAGVIAIAAITPASGAITPRVILAAFPLVTALAWYLRGVALTAVVMASAGALGLLTIVSLTTIALTP
jgi:hypothetical protein